VAVTNGVAEKVVSGTTTALSIFVVKTVAAAGAPKVVPPNVEAVLEVGEIVEGVAPTRATEEWFSEKVNTARMSEGVSAAMKLTPGAYAAGVGGLIDDGAAGVEVAGCWIGGGLRRAME
jgi:hypothetical protein